MADSLDRHILGVKHDSCTNADLGYNYVELAAVRLAPVIELFGWHLYNGFVTDIGGPVLGVATPAGGTDIVNIKAGVRTAIGLRNSFYIGYGKALTDAVWYDDIIRVEHRNSF